MNNKRSTSDASQYREGQYPRYADSETSRYARRDTRWSETDRGADTDRSARSGRAAASSSYARQDAPSQYTRSTDRRSTPSPTPRTGDSTSSSTRGTTSRSDDYTSRTRTGQSSARDRGTSSRGHARNGTPRTQNAYDAGGTRSRRRRLSHDEVAAVNYDRSYYVSDGPSPYLTPDQAREDIRRTKRRRSTVTTIVVIMVILVAIGGGIGYVWQSTRPATQPTEVWQYRTEEIYRGEFLATIETTALIRPAEEENIQPTVSGNIAEISVSEGTAVAVGDPLFKLENSTISESFKNAEKAFTEAQAQVDAKTQALEEISATIQALESAASTDTSNRATQAALASSYAKIDPAQVELNAATQTLSSMKETYERAKTQSEALTILSPIAGTVNQLNPDVVVGTPVTNAVRLCTISDLSSYCLDVEIPPSDSTRVTVGQEVRLTFPSIPDLTLTSTVESIRDESSIRLARIIISDADPRVTIGTAVHAQIIVQAIPDTLIVPLDSVTIGDDGFARLNILLDPSRGIKTEVIVNIIATNGTQAAVSADNIQEGNSVILNSSLAEAEQAQNPTSANTSAATEGGSEATGTEGDAAADGAAQETQEAQTPTPAPTAEEIQAAADELTKKAEESQQAAQEAADRAAALLGEDPEPLDTTPTTTDDTEADAETDEAEADQGQGQDS